VRRVARRQTNDRKCGGGLLFSGGAPIFVGAEEERFVFL
jgi:hypothetical protein